MKSTINSCKAFLVLTALLTGTANAQIKPVSPRNGGAYDWFGRAGLVCGGGASHAVAATKPTVQCGGVLSGPLFDLEIGAMGPQASQSNISGYLSTNLWFPLVPFKRMGSQHGLPLVVGGYTRMFQTGNALDYGIAYAYPIDSSHSFQFEARDYWVSANPSQHNVVFRVVWLVGLAD